MTGAPFVIGKLELLIGAACVGPPFGGSFKSTRRCSGRDEGRSFDPEEVGGASWREICEGRSTLDVSGGESMVCMSCLELVPLRSGFLVGRDRFSGESGRSMPLEPLLRPPPSKVPSRRSPPELLFGGGAIDRSAQFY